MTRQNPTKRKIKKTTKQPISEASPPLEEILPAPSRTKCQEQNLTKRKKYKLKTKEGSRERSPQHIEREVPTHWFKTEYDRHLSDCNTYNLLQNFDFNSTVKESNYLLTRLRSRFEPHLDTLQCNKQLLNNVTKNNLQLPYMKLLPKAHKLTEPASPSNLNKLTARPIITAHSWIMSNPSKLLGKELASLITKLKHLFETHNLNFPLIYNSMDLINKMQHLHVQDIDNLCLTTFDFTSLYTNISHQATINAIIAAWKLLDLPNFYRDYLLNPNDFINKRNFFTVGNLIYQQIRGVAVGSYQI